MRQKKVITAAIITALAIIASTTITVATVPVYAYHEQFWRDRGIGFNDFDKDGVTCAPTDQYADQITDQFFNGHGVTQLYLESCEAMEIRLAGDPIADDNTWFKQLLDQYDSIYGENNEKFTEGFKTFK